MNDTSRGLLLFAHGARDPEWARPFEAVAQSVRAQRPGTPLQLAYLEFMQPDLAQAGAQLVQDGCQAVEVLPLFLGAGGHVRKDLPRLLDALRAAHPGVRFELHPAVGELPAVVQAMAGAALSLLATKEANQP
ncbi:sirohydrochlorin chelatase [Azohydromonas australica]|uniref:sirohydrochlorin chelatase n=1 Tax=Azohydromonas australica TaxID=364039 RepID=UPI0004293736|nr:CbiX/SirB N-terminal domain-containing protein [Azohydromonas australica]